MKTLLMTVPYDYAREQAEAAGQQSSAGAWMMVALIVVVLAATALGLFSGMRMRQNTRPMKLPKRANGPLLDDSAR